MLLIALLVKLTSPGPVFYRQERCGLNGRPFQMLKFRRMRVDAEAQTGPVWAAKEDDRDDAARRVPAEDEPRRAAAVHQRAARAT